MEKIHYTRKEYREIYLRSEEWRDKSVFILQRDPICRVCDKKPSVDAHHLTYERIHHERESDLIGICRTCHNFIHAHKELSSIFDLSRLRETIALAKKGHIMDAQLMSRIENSHHGAMKLIAGVLKIPAHRFNALIGRKISFFKKTRIQSILKMPPEAFKPKKKRRRYGGAFNLMRV